MTVASEYALNPTVAESPLPYRFSVENYMQMVKVGILKKGDRLAPTALPSIFVEIDRICRTMCK